MIGNSNGHDHSMALGAAECKLETLCTNTLHQLKFKISELCRIKFVGRAMCPLAELYLATMAYLNIHYILMMTH